MWLTDSTLFSKQQCSFDAIQQYMAYRKIHKDNEVDIKKGNIFVMKTYDTH